MKRHLLIILFFVTGLITIGCTASESDDNTKLTIFTSIYPIQYAVERIGGDAVHAETIYPPGVDAHTYEPTTREMTAIAGSDAFIFLGAGMEGFAETAANALASQDLELVEIGKDKELFHGDTSNHDGHHHHDHNPHIWLDPVRMIDMASIIKDKLIDIDQENKKRFVNNFNRLKNDLLTLDQTFQKTIATKVDKKVLVSHAAYTYWEQRYGIEQIAISGLSSNDEPSQKELVKIIEQAKQSARHYVLFEQNTSDRVSEIIQNEIGAEALTIHNLSVLTEADIKDGENYLSLMQHNLNVLDQATK
ncbi:adhesin [Lentibacillus cibarius]|uniref:Adhesin n=1 Tax=Lentibacillus cibarius TaxID=2583219 RepID=A0A549YMI1_9BACI|nr:zinc ABC transporter substrate-binding protein [Lentibacillus cibarius]TRM13074.1 adhesin [Lentibacillus cibarius]